MVNRKIIMFGGLSGGRMFNHVQVYDPLSNKWVTTMHQGKAPSKRWGHSATLWRKPVAISAEQHFLFRSNGTALHTATARPGCSFLLEGSAICVAGRPRCSWSAGARGRGR